MPFHGNLYGQFVDSIGVELESVGLTDRTISQLTKDIRKIMGRNYLQITNDASVESTKALYPTNSGRLPIYTHTEFFDRLSGVNRVEKISCGYELITIPVEIEIFEKLMFHTLRSLENCGDFVTERSATHFHIGYANNLKLLKNLLRMCLWIDPFLFRLGGMGGTYRGYSNESIYARPLLYPPCVPLSDARDPQEELEYPQEENAPRPPQFFESVINLRDSRDRAQEASDNNKDEISGKFAKVLNVKAALSSSSVSEFWSCFGLVNPETGVDKYNPSRYVGCNFIAFIHHGTIEFRHFNQSLDYKLVIAVGKLLRAFVELASLINKSDINMFFVRDSKQQLPDSECKDTLELLRGLFFQYEIEQIPEDFEFELLLNTVLNSKFESISEYEILTHKKDFSLPYRFAKRVGLEMVEKVRKPIYTDIHTIGNYPLITKRRI
jgi:hypothetical protein